MSICSRFVSRETKAHRIMSNVVHVSFDLLPKDGSKARIRRRRRALGLERMFHGAALADDLTMRSADPEEDTRPSELA
jgi:hypothetical protein